MWLSRACAVQWRTIAMTFGLLALVACTSTRVIPSRDWHPSTNTASPARVTRDGTSAVVQRGDTLYSIAFRNGLDASEVAAWNGLGPPFTIYPGQRLRLTPPPGGAVTARPATPLAAGPASTAGNAPAAPGARPAVAGASGTPTLPPVAAALPSTLRWQWPTDGNVISHFAPNDPTRQGVDIAGKEGQPVRAAADGVVVYSGAGLVGYGELIIIKHDEHWLSAYGHNRARLVNEGRRVKAGDVIAEMGHSGAARDMLHFEIRLDGKPVDPERSLPPR